MKALTAHFLARTILFTCLVRLMACSEITENQQAEEIEVVDQHPFSAAACYGGWNGGSNIQ